MKKAIILLADNDKEFLETRRESLEREGLKVVPALDPGEARNILEQGGIDLAILDLRLLNDDDEKDLSGLNLAKRVAPSIPKIILTKFATVEAVREALGPQLEGLPPAVDFVAKQEGPQALLTAIRKVLKLGSRFREVTDGLALQIREDYEDARQQARWNYRVSLGVAVAGITIIFVGVGLTMGGMLAVGVPSVVAGVIAEAVGILFFRRADVANARMDRYHSELLGTRQFENLLAACDELLTAERQEKCKEKVIETAAELWLGQGKPKSQPIPQEIQQEVQEEVAKRGQ
jgi:CheY-like chemotaxis protein